MTEKSCPWEERVREAAAGNSAAEDLRAHIAACPRCRETATVTVGMGKVRAEALGEYATREHVSAAHLLELARMRRTFDSLDTAKVLEPLRIYRRLAVPAGLAGGLALAVWKAASLRALILSLPGFRTLLEGLHSATENLTGASLVGLSIAAGSGLLALLVLAVVTRAGRLES